MKKEIRVRLGRACFGAGLSMVLLGIVWTALYQGATEAVANVSLSLGQAAIAIALIGGGVGLCMPYGVDTN